MHNNGVTAKATWDLASIHFSTIDHKQNFNFANGLHIPSEKLLEN